MKYYWKCPVCGEKVDFSQFIYDLFDTEDGEAIFAPSSGVPFYQIICDNCDASWTAGISNMITSSLKEIYIVPYIFRDQLTGAKTQRAIMTYKEYWDKNKSLSNEVDDKILEVLEDLKIAIDGDNELDWEDNAEVTVEQLIDAMKEVGFNFILNDPKFMKDYEEVYGHNPSDVFIC